MDLEYTGRVHLDPHEFVEQTAMPFGALLDRIRDGEIKDSKTMLCALLWDKEMERGGSG
jgi:hypothetical protein